MNFDRHDDRASSQEAPVTHGIFLDVDGNRMSSRTDAVVERYMNKVSMTQDQYWQYRDHFDNRNWYKLDMFIEQLQKSAIKDDAIRLANARDTVRKILGEKSRYE